MHRRSLVIPGLYTDNELVQSYRVDGFQGQVGDRLGCAGMQAMNTLQDSSSSDGLSAHACQSGDAKHRLHACVQYMPVCAQAARIVSASSTQSLCKQLAVWAKQYTVCAQAARSPNASNAHPPVLMSLC